MQSEFLYKMVPLSFIDIKMISIFLTIEDVILKSSSFEQIIEVLDMNSTDE